MNPKTKTKTKKIEGAVSQKCPKCEKLRIKQICENCHYKGDDNKCHFLDAEYRLNISKPRVIWHEPDECEMWFPEDDDTDGTEGLC